MTLIRGLVERYRFRLLLVLLLSVLLAVPLAQASILGESLLIAAVGIISTSVLWITGTRGNTARLGIGVITLWAVVALAAGLFPVPGLASVRVVVALIMSLFVMWSVFVALLREARADVDALAGAIFGYFLLAVVFAQVYAALEIVHPGAFALDNHGPPTMELVYFSLVTITTLGYGDILPVAPTARILAGIEAALGSLYLAVLIGRIVGVFKRPDEA